MAQPPRATVAGIVLDSPDARELSDFYRRLLGWNIAEDQPDWVELEPPDGGTKLSFQSEPAYVPPAWPTQAGDQQMMMHLDIGVEDLDAAVAHALGEGAVLAQFQPQDHVRVCLDPAGHPFCLFPSA